MTMYLATANAIKASLAITLAKNSIHQQVIKDCFDAVDKALPSFSLSTISPQQHETNADSDIPQTSASLIPDGWAVFRDEKMTKPKQFCRRFRRSGHCKYGDACFYSETHSSVEVNNVASEHCRAEIFNIASDVGQNSDDESVFLGDSTVDTFDRIQATAPPRDREDCDMVENALSDGDDPKMVLELAEDAEIKPESLECPQLCDLIVNADGTRSAATANVNETVTNGRWARLSKKALIQTRQIKSMTCLMKMQLQDMKPKLDELSQFGGGGLDAGGKPVALQRDSKRPRDIIPEAWNLHTPQQKQQI